MLLTFSQPIYSASFVQDVFDSFQNYGTDATYFAGNCLSTCSPSGLTTSQLDTSTFGLNTSLFKSGSFVTASPTGPDLNGTATNTVTLGLGQPVNWILIGASTVNADGNPDYFKLNSMSYSTVPEPATFGLAGAALLGLGLLRRKKLFTNS